jgi:hypothetical protein
MIGVQREIAPLPSNKGGWSISSKAIRRRLIVGSRNSRENSKCSNALKS